MADRWLPQLPENMPNVYEATAAMAQAGTLPTEDTGRHLQQHRMSGPR